jgi:hypothetical protein
MNNDDSDVGLQVMLFERSRVGDIDADDEIRNDDAHNRLS